MAEQSAATLEVQLDESKASVHNAQTEAAQYAQQLCQRDETTTEVSLCHCAYARACVCVCVCVSLSLCLSPCLSLCLSLPDGAVAA